MGASCNPSPYDIFVKGYPPPTTIALFQPEEHEDGVGEEVGRVKNALKTMSVARRNIRHFG
jgi:hypothetical protein